MSPRHPPRACASVGPFTAPATHDAAGGPPQPASAARVRPWPHWLARASHAGVCRGAWRASRPALASLAGSLPAEVLDRGQQALVEGHPRLPAELLLGPADIRLA